jgi:hypothetical protein
VSFIAADERRRAAALADEPVEHADSLVGVDAEAAFDRKRLPGGTRPRLATA